MADVIRVNLIRNESLTVSEWEDLEEPIINTMGEDVWNMIQILKDKEIEEVKEDLVCANGDLRNYDHSNYCLKNCIIDTKENLLKVIEKITDSKRLDRRSLLTQINHILTELENCEGM